MRARPTNCCPRPSSKLSTKPSARAVRGWRRFSRTMAPARHDQLARTPHPSIETWRTWSTGSAATAASRLQRAPGRPSGRWQTLYAASPGSSSQRGSHARPTRPDWPAPRLMPAPPRWSRSRPCCSPCRGAAQRRNWWARSRTFCCRPVARLPFLRQTSRPASGCAGWRDARWPASAQPSARRDGSTLTMPWPWQRTCWRLPIVRPWRSSTF